MNEESSIQGFEEAMQMVAVPSYLLPVAGDDGAHDVVRYKEVLEILKAWGRPVEFRELLAPTNMHPKALMTCLMFLVAQGRVLYETELTPEMSLNADSKVYFTWFCDDIRMELESATNTDQAIAALRHDAGVAVVDQTEITRRVKKL